MSVQGRDGSLLKSIWNTTFIENLMSENSKSFNEDAAAILSYFNTAQEYQTCLQLYPCLYPVNQHMENLPVRVATFNQRWVESQVRATSRQIAEDQIFFLGVRGRVKCWYCDQGLHNWEYIDNLWVEH